MNKKISIFLVSLLMLVALCPIVMASGENAISEDITEIIGQEKINNEEQTNKSKGFSLENYSPDEDEIITYADDTTYTEGNYQYKIQKDYDIIDDVDINNTITSMYTDDIAIITKYTGNEEIVTIPAKLGGKRVYQIGEAAFYQNTSIKKLIIPDKSVGYIERGAFADCTNLSEVVLGSHVNNISYYAFQNTAITSIKLPQRLRAIRSTTFFHCENLTNITIDSRNVHFKVTESVIYEKYASGDISLIFYPWAKKNTSFTVPSGVTEIYGESIINNYLQQITIPASVTKIGTGASNFKFSGSFCFSTPALTTINVDSKNTVYSSQNGVLFSKDKKILYFYPSGKIENTYNIPNGTQIIESYAFYNSLNLNYINIPNTVKKIETGGFRYAESLLEITIPASVTEFGAALFEDCPSLRKATINANSEVLSYLTFDTCESLEEVIINGNIKRIIKGAFYYCDKLTKVVLPESLEQIDFGAFWDCRALKNIKIPKNCVFIEDCAFYEHLNYPTYEAATVLDISETMLQKQSDRSYTATYDYTVKGSRDYLKAYAVLDLVNSERKKAGVSPLTMDKDLLENAMLRSAEIVTLFEHTRPSLKDCFTAITKSSYGRAGENIAANQTTASMVMNSWMNSEGHRENILDSKFTSIGIGCFKADDGNYYWVQLFTNGTPTNTSKPSNKKVEEKIKIAYNKLPFNDVKKEAWYFDAIRYCLLNKMVYGINSAQFSPNTNISRGMLVTILYRIEGSPSIAGYVNKFSDLTNNKAWYYNAIIWASKNGIVNGYDDGTFSPNANITRQELAVMLANYCRFKGKYVKPDTNILNSFKDNDKIAPWAKESVAWAVSSKVISGAENGTKVNPRNTATRAEATTMLKNYLDSINK